MKAKKRKATKVQVKAMKASKVQSIGVTRHPLMCRSYRHYGLALIGVGAVFFMFNLALGSNTARTMIVAFFLILGVIDLILYMKFGEK